MLETEEAKQEVARFKKVSELVFTAFCMANFGMSRTANDLSKVSETKSLAPFAIGPCDPAEHRPLASLSVESVIEGMQDQGVFSQVIASGLLSWLYSVWDEEFRYGICKAEGCKKNDVKCDLMNDLRLIRHWILHNKMHADEKDLRKLKVLSWPSSSGSFSVGQAEFEELLASIHEMEVYLQSDT